MKYLMKLRPWAISSVLAVVLFAASGCGEEDLQQWADSTNRLRASAVAQGNVTPYRGPQHEALKAYFAEINRVAINLKNDPNYAEQFNDVAEDTDLQALCAKTLMPKRNWQAIYARCTRNNFFLCAEEVRAYQEMVLTIREKLTAQVRTKFDRTPSCRSSF